MLELQMSQILKNEASRICKTVRRFAKKVCVMVDTYHQL